MNRQAVVGQSNKARRGLRLLAAVCACGSPLVGAAAAVPAAGGEAFWLGADVSWVPQQERGGRRFSVDGKQQEILAILRGHGFNMVRLRLFVDPAAPGGYSAQGDCGLESTLAMAARVKAAGMGLLLNFHYSDTWADPGHQKKPAAWRELPFAELERTVERYTADVLTEFKRRGLSPRIVQTGNEISSGMLWPDGKVKEWDQFAKLLHAANRGVRKALPDCKIMLHLALGGQNDKSRWILDRAVESKVDFDLIGQSYYPRWHGTIAELKDNLHDLALRYRRDIVVVEYSGPQAREVNGIVRGLPGGRGKGSFIWEPTDPKHGALFDDQGDSLPALGWYPEIAKAAGLRR